MKYDFVAFGDITTDAFIRLKDAEVHCNVNKSECMLCVKFGQKIPFESVEEVRAVGNGPNAAVAASRIGLRSAIVTDLGGDENGRNCLETLKAQGVSTEFVRVHAENKTNYHYVLQYGAERTILIKHEHYQYVMPIFSEPPAWFYLTSLPEHALEYQLEIARYAKAHGVKLCFQPGTFQIGAGTDTLKEVYEATELFFCNKEEAQQILKTQETSEKTLMEGIRALGPRIVVITDGTNGANILDESGAWHVPMYPDPAPPISRTGAGDASASTTTSFIHLGLSPVEALLHGEINSMNVVQHVGAQTGLLTREHIEAWYAKRPEDFKPTAL